MTRWELHVQKWSNCTSCDLHKLRRNVVLGKGDIGASQILICGEAPGHSEDTHGKPFAGPAGHNLDEILKHCLHDRDPLRIAYTNPVCCIPLDENREKTVQPGAREVVACSIRLREFFMICKPKMVIAMGDLPKKHLPKLLPDLLPKPPAYVETIHPAAFFHMAQAEKGFAAKRMIVQIRTALTEVFGPPKGAVVV